MYVAVVLTLMIFCTVVCNQKAAREVPGNYILLFLFTLFEGYMVSCITIYYKPETVIIAAVMTLAVTAGLTLYAFFTKTDYTYCGGILAASTCVLFLGGFFVIVFNSYWLNMVYNGIGLIIYSIYLIYDT